MRSREDRSATKSDQIDQRMDGRVHVRLELKTLARFQKIPFSFLLPVNL